MAAVTGYSHFWNMTSEELMQKVFLHVKSPRAISVTMAAFMALISPVTVLGNVLVITAVWKDPLKKLRSSPSKFIILSMAIADGLVGLVQCPINGYWHLMIAIYGKEPFRFFVNFALNNFLVNVSIGHLLLLSVDRLIAVLSPLKYRGRVTTKTAGIAITVCWTYFVMFASSFLLVRENFLVLGAIHNLQMFLSVFFMLGLYIAILCHFHRYSRKSANIHEISDRSFKLALQRQKRLNKAIAIVLTAFLICFMPWFIVQLLIFYCRQCKSDISLLMFFSALSGFLVYTNSALNPILYSWRLPKFQETFKYFWKRRCKLGFQRQRRNKETNGTNETRF